MSVPSHRPTVPEGGQHRRVRRRAGAALAAVGLLAAGVVPLLSMTAGAETKGAGGALAAVPGLSAEPAPRPEAPPTALTRAVRAPVTSYPVPTGARLAAPSGTGTRCTVAAPCSLATAVERAPAGSTVVLRGGTYSTGDLSLRTRVTVQPYPREQVWVSGTVPVTGWVRDGARWRHDGWTKCLMPVNLNTQKIDPEHPMAGRRDQVFVDGRGLRQVGSAGAVGAGSFAVDCAADRIYVGSDPTGHRVEATAFDGAFSMWRTQPAGTVIRGLGFSGYASQALLVGAPRVVLENNVFAANAMDGVWFSGSTDSIVRGNVFTRNGGKGLGGGQNHRTQFVGNTVSYNNTAGFARNWGAAGAKFIKSDQLVLRSNLVEGNYSTGLWLDVSVTNATVVGNVSRNNNSIGIFAELSDRVTILSNISQGNGAGLMAADSSRVSMINNTVVGNKTGLVVKDGSRRNTDAAEVRSGVTWQAYGNVVQNNLLVGSTGTQLDISQCGGGTTERMVSVLNANGYQALSGGRPRAARYNDGSGRCGTSYATAAALRTATGMERAGVDISPEASLFVDAAGGDFRLRPGSPASGKGLALSSALSTLAGRPAGARVDLGAFVTKAGSGPVQPDPDPSPTSGPTEPSGSPEPSASPSPKPSASSTTPGLPVALPGLATGAWTVNGSATLLKTGAVSARGVRLTPAQREQRGSAIYPKPVAPVLTASFTVTMSGGTGADGVTLALLDPATSPTAVGVAGGGQGFSGLKGVAVSLDTWRNPSDPRAGLVGLATGGTGDRLRYQTVAAKGPALREGSHRVTVRTTRGTVRVVVDGVVVLDAEVALPEKVLVGFTGATGGSTDDQRITDVTIMQHAS